MKEIEVLQHLQMRGLKIFLDTVEYRAPHFHKELELIWVLSGALEIRSAQGKYLAHKGNLVVLNPKQTHALCQADAACTFLCIQVSPRFFAYSFPAIGGLQFDEPVLSQSAHDIASLLEDLTLSYLQQESGYELLCAGKMHLILHRLLQAMPHHVLTETEASEQDRRGERLNRLIDYVEHNHQGKISLSDFARREKRSMSYLSHFVKENLGQSFQDYVNAVRFQTACSLIAAGRERLLDVCAESGFSDYRYFSQTFRQRVGMTPEEYRVKCVSDGSGIFVAEAGFNTNTAPSLERFYSREESILLFKQLRQIQ